MHNVQHPDNPLGEEMTQPTPAMAIDNDLIVAIKEHLYSDLNGEAVILSMKNGKYYGLNEVGRTIWNAIKDPTYLSEIQARVMREYDVDENTCRHEVHSFVRKMHLEGLVEILDETAI
jgi:hypothetical protein